MASPDTSKGTMPTDTNPQTQTTTTNQAAASTSETPSSSTTNPPPADCKASQQQQQPPTEKKLTGAELKARAKAEKAARRAAKAVVVTSPAAGGPPAGADAKGKGKQKDGQKEGAAAVAGSGKAKTAAGAAGAAALQQQQQQAEMARKKKEKEEKEREIPEIFSHLPVAKQISYMQADKDTHFVVLILGQKMGSFVVTESTERMYYTLLALKKVIEAYITPAGNTLSRHFTSHMLNPQIEYLADCRPMCFSMGNAIRWLKLQIARLDIELSDEDAKKYLCEQIDDFTQEKVIIAQSVIIENAAESIQPGDVVVTYASHSLVKSALLKAHRRQQNKCQCGGSTEAGAGTTEDGDSNSKLKTEDNKSTAPKKSAFKVIVVDDAHDHSGREMAKQLQEKGIDVIYTPDVAGALRVMKTATKTLLAAEAVFSNGAVYARAGTADVALAARDAEIEVNVMCESINFTERMATDSLTYNEIDPSLRMGAGFRLLFDTTSPEYVSTILSEHGGIRPHMVPGILKRMEFL